ncbi:tRNA lysidine(34) synthetase TilS [Malaciobacter halophilus]|uniref:tRNA(Ile)-lysidine synthase n=1 Tax=Malaciobacter halophilus TaxID=197482 RepID=A0A2N1J5D6_9BACT|nr:tRNA lysidine(34) synthetase TilS [Malaciobacter halophilus]AXH10749.1 tRNA(Ile)-lysidine synthetase [Malaciobacter halophilus]PKI81771.1 tRNA lysidine(34) synthetase TilS [Malaciobacter halophilus]
MRLSLNELESKKNLLAFSAGVDSTALFFLLKENNIEFDIAIVNYNLREESKEELAYAKALATKYKKEIFIKELTLEGSNIEKKARDIRYAFFEEIIKNNNYENLITAHQLNDKLEWFLMQLSKGAGLVELLGLQEYIDKENYKIVRPLLHITKNSLEAYLKQNNIKYFIDKSNFEEKYKRNYFRHEFSNRFLDEFENGVSKSFDFLQKDLKSLNINYTPIFKEKSLTIFKNLHDENLNIKVIDKHLKKEGFLLSKAQRDEIIKQQQTVISNQVAVCINEEFIWICPYVIKTMNKKFKEFCRINKIPKLARAYIFNRKIDEKEIVKAIYS